MPTELELWQGIRLAKRRTEVPRKEGPSSVTVLAYHFWPPEQSDSRFGRIESAIRETWAHCGLLRTVLVMDRTSAMADAFRSRFIGCVDIQEEPSLVPGDVHTMSLDCIQRLHRRFTTDYVLIVQEDGFPIRGGLEEHVGRWDFIGAPYVRDTWSRRLACGALNCWVSNGGFSLRSKRVCEFASQLWDRRFGRLPRCRASSEDIYYTETLPLRSRLYRRSVRIADNRSAAAFSYDAIFAFPGTSVPFGFHGPEAFGWLRRQGWIAPAEET